MRKLTTLALGAAALATIFAAPALAEYHGGAPNLRSADGMRWKPAAYSGRDGRFGTWRQPAQQAGQQTPTGQKMHMCGGGIRCIVQRDDGSYNGRKVMRVIGADPEGAGASQDF
jgi:hypothetical protein